MRAPNGMNFPGHLGDPTLAVPDATLARRRLNSRRNRTALALAVLVPIGLVAWLGSATQDAARVPPLAAQAPPVVTPRVFDSSRPSFGGLPRAMAIRDTTIYVAQGWRIDTFAVDEPAEPRRVEPSLQLDGPARDLAVRDDRLFATVGRSLRVFSLREGESPTPLAVLDLGAEASALHIDGDRGYVALQHPDTAAIGIVDVSDASAPISTIEIPTGERAVASLATFGSGLYAAGDRLSVYDVSDPGRPIAGDTSAVPDCCYQHVAVAGDRLIATYDARRSGSALTFFSAFTLDDPLRPVDVGGTGTNRYEVLRLRVRDGWVLKLSGTWRDPSWLSVFAGEHAADPGRYLARSGVLGTPVDAVATDSHVYVVTESCGLQSIEWDPPAMERLEFQDLEVGGSIPVAGPATDVTIASGSPLMLTGDYRWCSRLDRLPDEPVGGSLPDALAPLPGVPAMMVRAARGAYLLESTVGPISSAPRLIAATADGGLRDRGRLSMRNETAAIAFDRATAELFALSSNAALSSDDVGRVSVTSRRTMADSDAWFERFGGSDGTTPLGVAHIEGLEWPLAMAADAGRVAVLAETSGAEEEDFAILVYARHGGAPVLREPFPFVGDQPYAMAIRGPALYVAGAGLRAYAIDSGGKERRRWESPREPSYEKSSLDLLGDRLAYAEGDLVVLYDIRAPFAPRMLSAWRLPSRAEGVALRGDRLLAVLGDEGMASLSLLPAGWVEAERIYLPALAR